MATITISHEQKPGFVPVIQRQGRWIFADRCEFEARVEQLVSEGLTTSDAQGGAEAEVLALAAGAVVQNVGRESAIHTLNDLALSWFEARRSMVHEFAGSIRVGLGDLRHEAETRVNPLLVAHRADPLDLDTLLANDFLDEEE